MKNVAFWSMLLIIAVFLGCESSSDPSGTGELALTLVDSPAGYDAVNIVVTSVAVHTSANASEEAGWTIINNVPAIFDLLELRNGVSAALGTNRIPPAHYTQIRLMIGSGSNVVVDGTAHPLEIPVGIQSGVKLTHAFAIEEDKLYQLTLDFDAEKSIFVQGNNVYRLQPTIRVVATVTSGSISGVVQPDSAEGVVYAMSGTDTVTTSQADTTSGAFVLTALPEGTYSVLIEAASGTFQPQTRQNVTVVRQQNTDLGTITLLP